MRGGEDGYLAWLITTRSRVQVPPAQPTRISLALRSRVNQNLEQLRQSAAGAAEVAGKVLGGSG
jgi:hypothetical protein